MKLKTGKSEILMGKLVNICPGKLNLYAVISRLVSVISLHPELSFYLLIKLSSELDHYQKQSNLRTVSTFPFLKITEIVTSLDIIGQ